jgi:serine/threonine protein kinase
MALAEQQLGHYHLIRLIGQGGMGEVYLAEDTRISRQVAVKVIRTELQSYLDDEESQHAEELFEREMKAISRLDHPYILSFYDFGKEPAINGSIVYMVMPYRQEGSLSDWLLRRGSHLVSPQDIGLMIAQAASALQHAHDHDVIHRDVKPSNFLVRANADHPTCPDLFLVDFGLARVISATSMVSNSIRGTYSCMAPEQWSGEVHPASDQYALAIMSYLLLTGQLPFQGQLEHVMFQHLTVSPKPPSELNSSLSPAIDDVILRALAKKTNARFPTIKAFAVALQQAVDYADLHESISVSPAAIAPPFSPSEAIQPSDNATLLVSSTDNRNKLSKQRTILLVTLALLLILSGVLVVLLVNKAIVAGSNRAVGTAQSIALGNATSTALVRATNATATAQVADSTATAIAANPNLDPYQPSGTLTFEDPLSQPQAWRNRSNMNWGGRCQFVNGVYQISQSQPRKNFICSEDAQYMNFAAEVKMTINQGDCGGMTIRGNTDFSKLYFFRICQDGSYSFAKYMSSGASDAILLRGGNSPEIKRGIGQLNVIAIVANGNSIDLYINHQKIDSASDNTYSQGSIGLLADAPGSATTVNYQDARVWTIG